RRVPVHPIREGRGLLPLEEQQQVPQVSLGVDGQDRNAAAEDLLDEHDGLAGLARAGHAHDQAVRQEVRGIEQDPRAQGARCRIDLLAEVEAVFHREASISKVAWAGDGRCGADPATTTPSPLRGEGGVGGREEKARSLYQSQSCPPRETTGPLTALMIPRAS